MRAWDHKTGRFFELLTKKQAVAQGWAKEADPILGVRLVAVPIKRKGVRGFDQWPSGGVVWSTPEEAQSILFKRRSWHYTPGMNLITGEPN